MYIKVGASVIHLGYAEAVWDIGGGGGGGEIGVGLRMRWGLEWDGGGDGRESRSDM